MKKQKKRTVKFRQWSGKAYAIFNSLKVVVKICVLSVAYSLVSTGQDAKSQTDTAHIQKVTEIEGIEVSGQRAPVVASQLSRIVTVITRKEVERAPVQSLNDLLKYVPQVDIRQRGVNGVQADVSIQGGSSDQTLILLNGINLSDPQTGHHNLNLPFDIDCIDRIEILKGGASRVFGTNAFSGAINFITGQDTENHLKASMSAGDFGFVRASLSVNQNTSLFSNLIAASHSKSNGYIHNTSFDASNGFYHGKIKFKPGYIGVQLGITKKEFGANGFYSPKYPDQYETTDTYFGAINAELGTAIIKISPNIYWRRNYDHYILIHDQPTIYQNFHYTDAYGGGLNFTVKENWGRTTMGMDLRKEIIYSNNLGLPVNNPKAVKGQPNYFYNLSDSRTNKSIYLEQNVMLGNFGASIGTLINSNTSFTGLKIYPGFDVSYKISPSFKIYGSLNNALRLPSFTDLYYHGPQNQGNRNLKPETAWTYEYGFMFFKPGLQFHLSNFHRDARNVIDWIKDQNQDSLVWHTVNFTKITTDGVEEYVKWNPGEWFSQKSILKEITVSYSLTNESKTDIQNIVSNYALDYLTKKFTSGITFEVDGSAGITLNYTLQERNGLYAKYDPATSKSTYVPYPTFSLVDGKIYGQYKKAKVYFEATNIFNIKYIDLGNIAQPGRWFKLGVDINVNWN